MVGRHQFDRAPREDALLDALPVVEHHLAEGEQIVNGRNQPPNARFERGRSGNAAIVDAVEDFALTGSEIGPIAARKPIEPGAGTLNTVSFMPSGAKIRSEPVSTSSGTPW
jgi:hypothetical protein